MTVQFKVSQREYIHFNVDHFCKAKSARGARLRMRFILPLLLFVVLFMLDGFKVTTTNVISSVSAALVWSTFLYKIVYEKTIRQNVVKYINSGNADSILGNQKITLLDTGMEESNNVHVQQIEYSAIEAIKSDHDIYYIYTGPKKAVIIPYSAFDNARQRQDFINLLSEKTGIDVSMLKK